MYILAIETTGPVGSVAVAETAKPCTRDEAEQTDTCRRIPMKVTTKTMSHLKNLMAMTDELLKEEGIQKSEIAAVAASTGPGSFTGIRIGVSTARALAQAWDVPCISVPSLEVFRQKCGKGSVDYCSTDDDSEDDSKGGSSDGSVCVIFNARRGQVYGACYGKDGETLIEPGPYMLSDMLSRIETLRITPEFYGDGVDAYFGKEEFAPRISSYEAAPPDGRYQTAVMAAEYAKEKWQAGETIEYGELLPDYMRESEAEQRLKDGSLEKMRKEKLERLMKMAGKE